MKPHLYIPLDLDQTKCLNGLLVILQTPDTEEEHELSTKTKQRLLEVLKSEFDLVVNTETIDLYLDKLHDYLSERVN